MVWLKETLSTKLSVLVVAIGLYKMGRFKVYISQSVCDKSSRNSLTFPNFNSKATFIALFLAFIHRALKRYFLIGNFWGKWMFLCIYLLSYLSEYHPYNEVLA